MLKRISGFTFAVLALSVATSFAVETITDPTASPVETWHYGTGSNNQTVSFIWNNGCSAYTIKIVEAATPGNEFFSTGYGAPSGNPVTTNITVPDPLLPSVACTLKVIITHTMGNTTTISQGLNIATP